ncbi:hypothetical protein [endosymbiont GvMRE of Glomus versiforme]|uniref:hypothetical protein n=1 Tax=endosymbiont GvMRE of Glomus versiforme TaxID=2039283 RepID=UPI000ED28A79|nr:hypothetical protein [endosymbiont GvMRE of Glomus versiforme]RHZ36641.1 hypothetical protein GvMRE_I2g543 [endosymbiont GvMRE of Glomus versiforme]
MITCCEIAIALAFTNLLSLAVFAGYTVHWKDRTLKLEQKNGSEQKQINQLKAELSQVKKQLVKKTKPANPNA